MYNGSYYSVDMKYARFDRWPMIFYYYELNLSGTINSLFSFNLFLHEP